MDELLRHDGFHLHHTEQEVQFNKQRITPLKHLTAHFAFDSTQPFEKNTNISSSPPAAIDSRSTCSAVQKVHPDP